jgi:hypothetical protein
MNNWRGHNNFPVVNNWRVQGHVQDGHNMGDTRNLPDGHAWQQPSQAQEGNNVVNRQQERGNMSIDNVHKECEWSLVVGQINTSEIVTSDLGLSLNDPDVWIGDTGLLHKILHI